MGSINQLNVNPQTGLILSGGGARAAYQVGVLKAVAELVPDGCHTPFPIICGTSAGAISAAGLASHADDFCLGVKALENVWSQLTPEKVYRTELMSFLWMLFRWIIPGVAVGYTPDNSALLDSKPLRELLELVIDRRQIQQNISQGDLRALCITASSYDCGESVSFFQAAGDVKPWGRVRRLGVPGQIGVQHLMASSAIPILFPAQRIGGSYYGDGALRQLSPISPAIHLGAEKILVIGVSGDPEKQSSDHSLAYPSLAQVFGHVLNSVFLDTLEGDVERLERINRTLSLMTPESRTQTSHLRHLEVLKIYPSEPIEEIAERHLHKLPRSLRFFLRSSGGTKASGASAISYLLFHPGFCRALIALGYRDGMAQKDEIVTFLDLASAPCAAPTAVDSTSGLSS